jgi:ABC-type uncharacterized transport system substrate-binding protein
VKFDNIGDTDSNVGVIFCMWKTGLIAAALTAGLAGAANAHPHVFVESRAEVVFDEAGRLSAVRHVWSFDEAFTAFAVQGLDENGDGELSREELQPLAQVNVESLAEYDFFTFLQQDGADIAFEPPSEYWLDFYGGRLTLFFTLPLREARVMDASNVELDVFDPNYFVAFEMTQDTPFAMVDAPKTCTLDFTPPPPLDPQTATTLAAIPQSERELPPDLVQITETLSNSARIGCK